MHRGATTSAALPTRHALLHCKHVGHQSGHPRRREIHGGPRQGGGGGAGQARRGRAGGGAAAAHEPPPQLARPASTAATQRRFGRGHWAVAALQLHAGATESSAGRSRARLLAHARRAALRAQLQAGGPLRTGARLGVAPLRRPRRCQIGCACTVRRCQTGLLHIYQTCMNPSVPIGTWVQTPLSGILGVKRRLEASHIYTVEKYVFNERTPGDPLSVYLKARQA